MSRKSLISLLGILLFASVATVQARMVINVDTVSPVALVNVNLKDADLAQALLLLFSETKGRFSVQVGVGVSGTIANLQFTQKPFDEALSSMLTSVDARLTFTADGSLYQVFAPEESGIAVPSFAAKTVKYGDVVADKIPVIKVKLKKEALAAMGVESALLPTATTGTVGLGGLTTLGNTTTTLDTAATPASTECLLAMITIQNISVSNLSEEFGFGYIPAFDDINYTSSSTTMRSSSRSSSSSSNNQNNNNNNNNQNNNNNNSGNYNSNSNSNSNSNNSNNNSNNRNSGNTNNRPAPPQLP